MKLLNRTRSRKKKEKTVPVEGKEVKKDQDDFGFPVETSKERAEREKKYEIEMLRKILDPRNEGVTYPVEKNDYGF